MTSRAVRREGNSPIDLRDNDALETYHPSRALVRQSNVAMLPPGTLADSNNSQNRIVNKVEPSKMNSPSTKAHRTLRDRLTQQMARLSSLDSTRSSSSIEVDSNEHHQAHGEPRRLQQVMPLISITSNDSPTASYQQTPVDYERNVNRQRRLDQNNDYYGRSRAGLAHDGKKNRDDDEDEDCFEDPILPIPYSSSSMARSTIVRQHTDADSMVGHPPIVPTTTNFTELLDDRQGMNESEQQFTKGEVLNRPSIDGSIISELRPDGKKSPGTGKGGSQRKDKQRRSKSPSSSSVINMRRGRQSKRGFLGLASRLRLTRKHDSIAKLQLSILNSGFVSLKTMDKDLQTFLPKERLTPKDFEARVKLMRKYEVLATIEYKFASRYETYVCKHATQESNQIKNNYKKCIPYDYNRVVLRTLPNVLDSDYINASHVDSHLKPNAYIAAQGPNENTIDDFWRMIWEQKSFVVVMLTKVYDFMRVMCNQYWPVKVNKSERYGNLEVTLLYEEPLADFVIRTIKITRLRGNLATTAQSNGESNDTANNTDSNNNNNSNGNGNGNNNQEGSLNGTVGATSQSEHQFQRSDSYDGYDYSEDDSSASEELILNPAADELRTSQNSMQNLPSVRLPKFISRPRNRERDQSNGGQTERRKRSSDRSKERENSLARSEQFNFRNNSISNSNSNNLDQMQRPSLSGPYRSASQPPPESSRNGARPPNVFLHPLMNSAQLAASSGSIPTVLASPVTPTSSMTPRTPGSAGLDRSSATRKAVKKKRRARVKNVRPAQTQFLVPDESQLLDDEDEDFGTAALDGDESGGKSAQLAGGTSNERIIYQFHYKSWASHTCPSISSLLHFRRRVRICMDEMSKSGKTGPTVVHCNDGCGRTGTYLCIDANLELAEEDNVYDVYNYTKRMRQSRKFLIENLEQYKFVYDTIEEAMFCGRTWFPVSELHKRLKHKSQRNPLTKKNEYQREYEKITRMTSKFSIGDCAGGHRVENREKNRDVSTVPPDNFRPYLSSFQSNDSTDYINAVFVDGYTRSKEYIVTEWPLHRTISDFWSLVYDHDCNSVILLANPTESSTYPSFLPSEKELRRKFGPVFSAEMVSYTHYQNIKSWIYTINKKIVSLTEVIAGVKSEAKTTQVFQITCWPQGHRVPTSTNALVELMNMVERWRQRTAYGPVCVVSLNGKSRAGVYCAANVAIEQVVQHSEVDVFQAVKTVRRHRPQLIENMTEYKYCYDLILHYVLHYVNQSPTAT